MFSAHALGKNQNRSSVGSWQERCSQNPYVNFIQPAVFEKYSAKFLNVWGHLWRKYPFPVLICDNFELEINTH